MAENPSTLAQEVAALPSEIRTPKQLAEVQQLGLRLVQAGQLDDARQCLELLRSANLPLPTAKSAEQLAAAIANAEEQPTNQSSAETAESSGALQLQQVLDSIQEIEAGLSLGLEPAEALLELNELAKNLRRQLASFPENERSQVIQAVSDLRTKLNGLVQAGAESTTAEEAKPPQTFQSYIDKITNLEQRIGLLTNEAILQELDSIVREAFDELHLQPDEIQELAKAAATFRDKITSEVRKELNNDTQNTTVNTREQSSNSEQLRNMQEVQELKELVVLYSDLLTNNDSFDPREPTDSGEVPLKKLSALLKTIEDLLPKNSSDISINREIGLIQNEAITPTKTLINDLVELAKKIDESQFSDWKKTTLTTFYDSLKPFEAKTDVEITEQISNNTLDTDISALQDLQQKVAAIQLTKRFTGSVLALLTKYSSEEELNHLYHKQEKAIAELQSTIRNEVTRRTQLSQQEDALQARIFELTERVREFSEKGKATDPRVGFEVDNIEKQFSAIYRAIEEAKKEMRTQASVDTLRRLELQALVLEFEERKHELFLRLNSIEAREIDPPGIGNEKAQIVDEKLLGEMTSIAAKIRALSKEENDVAAKKAAELLAQISKLRSHTGIRIASAFMWGSAKYERFYGNNGVFALTDKYKPNDDPLTGEIVDELLFNDLEFEGELGSNFVLGKNRIKVREDVYTASPLSDDEKDKRGVTRISENTEKDAAGRERKVIELEYNETAAVWISRIITQVTNRARADNKLPIKIELLDPLGGVLEVHQAKVPNGGDNSPIRARNLHLSTDQLFDFILKIDARRVELLRRKVETDPKYKDVTVTPIDISLVRRIFRNSILTEWPDNEDVSKIGGSNPDGYKEDWTDYWRKERQQGVASYNPLSSVFLFGVKTPVFENGLLKGYKKKSPWELLGDSAPRKVRDAIDRAHGGRKEYGYLINSFITLEDTARLPVIPTHIEPQYYRHKFSVLATHMRMHPAAPSLPRFDSDVGQSNTMMLTLDDLRTTRGDRAYPLVGFDQLGSFANNYVNTGKNGTAILKGVLSKDVSQWDTEQLLTSLRKDAKYAISLFPVVGLEFSHGKGQLDLFLNRFAVYIVLIKSIMELAPSGFFNGGDKDLEAVERLLTSERSKNTITEEDEHVIFDIIQSLYRAKVFRREMFQSIAHQVKEFAKVS